MAMIRIGIVGCGRILNAHLQGYRQLREAGIDDFRITALCARKREDALMFRRRGEGPPPRPPVLDPSTGDPLAAPHIYLDDFQPDADVAVYTDYREMIASGDVDAVNDFTSLFMHHQVGMAALDAGQHLLTQKPLAISVKAGRALVDTASAKGLTLGVFENVRQSLGTRVAAWVVRQGLIGDLQMALVGGIGGLWSPDKVVADTPWRHRKLLGGGGGTIDIGVHVMHLLRYVCGEIQAVQGTVRTFEPTRAMRDSEDQTLETVAADVDDTYFATVLFENGAVGQMLWSWAAHGEPASIPGAPIFYGTKGCLKGGEVILDDGTRTSANDLFESQADQALKERFFPLGLRDPFAVSQYDWLRAIEQGVQPETSGEQGLRDLAASFAMIESSERQAAVTLDAVLDGRVDDYQAEINEYYGL
jgi:predicted dehydrogenase